MTGPGDTGGPKGERLRLSSYEDAASLERVSETPGAPGTDRVTVASGDAPASRRPAPTRSHGTKRVVVSAQPRSLEGPAPEASQGFTARVLTLFPDMFPGPLGGSLTGKALKDGIWSLEPIDIRAFATDKHRSVDAPPAGGGPGLVMKPDVLGRAFDFAGRGTAGQGRHPSVRPIRRRGPARARRQGR